MSEAIDVRAYVEPVPAAAAAAPEVERLQRPDVLRDAVAVLLTGAPGRALGAALLASGVLLAAGVLYSLYARYRRDWCAAAATAQRQAIGRDDVLL